MKLRTLGVDGGYTKTDVQEVARALTGATYQAKGGENVFVFRPALHDSGAKIVLGHVLPAGRGIEDGNDVLDILARHPSTARHIAFKLARRLVSDSPPPGLVARAAETFRRTDGDIPSVVRTIITSPEFFSKAAFRAKVKTPFELVVSARRAPRAVSDRAIVAGVPAAIALVKIDRAIRPADVPRRTTATCRCRARSRSTRRRCRHL